MATREHDPGQRKDPETKLYRLLKAIEEAVADRVPYIKPPDPQSDGKPTIGSVKLTHPKYTQEQPELSENDVDELPTVG